MKEFLYRDTNVPTCSSLAMLLHDGVTRVYGWRNCSRNDNDDGENTENARQYDLTDEVVEVGRDAGIKHSHISNYQEVTEDLSEGGLLSKWIDFSMLTHINIRLIIE